MGVEKRKRIHERNTTEHCLSLWYDKFSNEKPRLQSCVHGGMVKRGNHQQEIEVRQILPLNDLIIFQVVA